MKDEADTDTAVPTVPVIRCATDATHVAYDAIQYERRLQNLVDNGIIRGPVVRTDTSMWLVGTNNRDRHE